MRLLILIMSAASSLSTRWGARFAAFLLIAGGILGIIVSVALAQGFAQQQRLYRIIVPLISIAVFVWGGTKGIDLWRGKSDGYRWGKILFALQIPAFSAGRLSYEYSTCMSARILFGNSNRTFGADIGSSLNLLISPEPLGWMVEINILALINFMYLLKVSPAVQRAYKPRSDQAIQNPDVR